MKFWNKLFGKNEERANVSAEDVNFTKEFKDAAARYLAYPGAEIEFSINDTTQQALPLNVQFNDEYKEWKEVQSVWDRRGILFGALDKFYLHNIERWKVVERYVMDRYPTEAIKFVMNKCEKSDFADADFRAALAKCFFCLNEYEKGLENAEKALTINPDSKRAKMVYADLLHVTGQHDKAHAIYNEILKSSKLTETTKTEISFLDILGFHEDILPSSVYAVGLLNNEESTSETWDSVAGEFYYSPYFRLQHAYWLMEHKEVLKGIVKLITLTQEFPTCKEGACNAYSSIKQLREQTGEPALFDEEFQYLEKLITENNWPLT